jgi:hypothetical protein
MLQARLCTCVTCCARQVFDVGDASITDTALLKFLSASGPWLEQLQAVDLKQCHYVTGAVLAVLRKACPKLRKLAPSRWAEHTALTEVAQFPVLEVRWPPPGCVWCTGRVAPINEDKAGAFAAAACGSERACVLANSVALTVKCCAAVGSLRRSLTWATPTPTL